jgi:EAL domain-containing protein (putative c-di-GMP-specific phosphodiesterase class I)
MSALYRMADDANDEYRTREMLKALVDEGWLVPVGQWFIERADGQKVAGPFETEADAHMARVWVEIAKNPETFWIRRGGGGE